MIFVLLALGWILLYETQPALFGCKHASLTCYTVNGEGVRTLLIGAAVTVLVTLYAIFRKH